MLLKVDDPSWREGFSVSSYTVTVSPKKIDPIHSVTAWKSGMEQDYMQTCDNILRRVPRFPNVL